MEGLKARRQSNSGKKQSNDGTRQFAFLGAPPQWLDEPKGTNNNATVHIDHDNYDSDGESLDSISGRSFRAKTPVGTTTGETALEGMSLFLQRLINEKFNPLSELHEYYQRKKVGIQECFEEVSAVGNTKGYGIYWHCSFRCPISNVSVTSCIPAPIFISSWDADESLQNQTAELLCGEMNWDLEEEGWVYFSSKKAAKKSCAWAALQRIGSSSLPVDANVLRLAPSRNRALEMIKDCCTEVNSRPLLQSISGSPTLAQQYETDNLVNLNASLESATGSSSLNRDAKLYYSAPPNNPNASNKKFPVWVEVLYDLGVSTIDITYREYVDAGKNDFTGEWRMEATQICCQMAIRSPIVIKTIGNPCYSKEKARQSSLTLFQLEMERLARTKSLSRENAASARSREIAKEHLLSCDAKDIQIVHSLPAWAMPRQTECDNSNTKHPWFLYELDLQTQSGGCLLDHYTNWKNSKQTRVGILVPAEINPSLLTGESFSTLFHNSINPEDLTNGRNAGFRARATLVKKKLVDSPLQSFVSADGSLVEYEVALRHFNKTLINWKHYGCGNRAVANQGIADNTTGFHSRGYLFVPLLDMDPTDHEGLGIDYELIKRNWDSTYESLFIGTCCQYELPLVGSFGWKSIAMSSFLLFLLFHPSFYTDRTGSCVASAWETLFSSFFLVICVNSVLLAFLVPTHSIPFEALNNRFVRHRGICYYVAPKNKESITMWSRFPTNNLHTPTSREDASDKQGKEPQPNFSTFNDYYLQKFGVEVHYPNEKLIGAVKVDKLTIDNPCYGNVPSSDSCVFLVPELVYVLPMPRDMLYAFSMADQFMPELERMSLLRSLSHFQLHEQGIFVRECSQRSRLIDVSKLSDLLANLLNEATTIFPSSKYERLEFLGDAVLGFALAVATLASNTTLTWDDIDLRENISSAARNVELCQASLRVGLLKLARACPNPMQTLDAGHTEQLDDLCSAKRLNVGIMNSVAADMFESVLAALFLCGRQSDCGKELSSRLMVGLLNSASLPAVSHSAPSVCTFSSNLCINKGFAFDETWENQLFTLFRESICFVFTKPDDSISLLCDNLHAGACHREIIEQTIPKALLSCALFNGLESIFDVTILKHESARNNVRMLEHLREILFHVGAYSLQLCLSEDLFNSFKNASPGDLHLLRAAAITDDAVAFVMVKNELHLSLSRESLYADLFTNCQGIAGGRFINRSSKLPGEQTKELVVSFKAIFGALVVCLGMDHAWLLVKSMFAELTALSPEDLRRLHSSSTLVSSYQ